MNNKDKCINLIKELDLIDNYNEQIESFKKMKTTFSFAWVNLANRPLMISKLFDLIKNTPYLLPPRTGHIGNWNDIIEGYISYRNDNTIICSQEKIGYPLIFDLTQTEDSAMENGDLTYLPGSIINHGKRQLLTYFTWDGVDFVQRSRENSLFVPFVLTKIENTLVPIIKVHQKRNAKYIDINFTMLSSIIYTQSNFIKEILSALIEDIIQEGTHEQELKILINRFVKLNGQVFRENIRFIDHCFYIGDTIFDSVSSLVEAIMYPYMAAAEPDEFFANIKNMPHCIPLLSNHFIVILTAILNTHLLDKSKSLLLPQEVNTHMQWGGIEMAGYPPIELGYFHREVRYIRVIHRRLLKIFNNMEPIYFILLPSSIFLLWPSDCHPNDLALVEKLINMVNKKAHTLLELPTKALFNEIDKIVNLWIEKVNKDLSTSFKNRFKTEKPSIYSCHMENRKIFLEPKGFHDLTIQQASMIVGSLFKYYSNKI